MEEVNPGTWAPIPSLLTATGCPGSHPKPLPEPRGAGLAEAPRLPALLHQSPFPSLPIRDLGKNPYS